MRYRLFDIMLAVMLALAVGASAAAESLAAGAKPTVQASAKPEAQGSPFGDMPTLPPADLLLGNDGPEDESSTPVAAEAASTPSPIADAEIEDDGMLRVELRSLGQPALLHLTLCGSYAVEADPGFRFASGTEAVLSAAQDEVWLSVGGLTIDMGKSLTLTRHRAPEAGENGIRIRESEKDALYCGDLSVTARGSGLYCVLRLAVEDYLYGVVAHEMSDSFPLEALKAQAVAARTYAMQRKHRAGQRAYDVTDTTADQVFKGYDPEYAKVIQAVDDTRGVVGLYEGGFATCYYTASNGGQTALPEQIWGGKGGDYLAMTDDPYDLENPRSLQNTLTVSPNCEGSAALKAMLEAALGDAMAKAGVGEGAWQFDSIAAVRPVNPRFEGSRMCDGLEFDLRARLLTPSATPEPSDAPAPTDAPEQTPESQTASPGPTAEPTAPPMEWVLSEAVYPVTLDVYTQIKDGLSLGLNGADYELVDAQTEADDAGNPASFTIIMRRFGHGVGMSQRGAQWMAGHYGMTWRDILDFYYPGMTLARMNWPENTLTALSELADRVGAARPEPTPKPLPELKAGEHYATVTASALNVREEPTTEARIVERLANGRRVIVASEPDADGWVRVRTGEVEGFVKGEYLGN